jgi:RES domain-containing protein
VDLWRISNRDSLNGEGGLYTDGRWHTVGRPLVYCSESPAAALLEMLVRLNVRLTDAPARYRLLRIHAPDTVTTEIIPRASLETDWTANRTATQAIGDAWLAEKRSPLLCVPSAIAPETSNFLLNPAHADATRVVVASVSEHELDSRLLR